MDSYGTCRTEFEFIKSLQFKNPGGQNKGKQSKNTYILKETALNKLATFIEQKLQVYANEILATSTKLFITQSWANLDPPGSLHHLHFHSNSIVSGSLYLSPEENMSPIVFHREPPSMRLSTNGYNSFNNLSYSIKPAEGRLLLFPSTLRHSVEINKTETDRYSISFNTFAESFGDVEQLDYLR